MYQTIEKELDSIREHYQVPRRTKVTNASLAVFEEEPAVVSDVVFVMNRFGYVKLVDKALFDKMRNSFAAKMCVLCHARQTHVLLYLQRKVFFII